MKKIYIITSLAFIISCGDFDAVVDLEIPSHNSVLVMNGVLSTDTNVRIVISNSVGAFDNNTPSFIPNANAYLFEENILIDTLKPNLSEIIWIYVVNNSDYSSNEIPMYLYECNTIPIENKKYKIEVSHEDYVNSITSTSMISKDVDIYDVSIDTSSFDDKIRINFSFNDDPTINNYYQIRLYSSCSFDDYYDDYFDVNEKRSGNFIEMYANDPSFPQSEFLPDDGYTFIGRNILFKDALFNGIEKNISIDVNSFEKKLESCDTIFIEFSSLSYDSYSYFKSYEDHISKGELGIFGGEVVPVYSNVNNGLGVLLSRNRKKVFIRP